jgi:hypothetical protein
MHATGRKFPQVTQVTQEHCRGKRNDCLYGMKRNTVPLGRRRIVLMGGEIHMQEEEECL